MAQDKVYIAIDLKSFYASQECVERGLDPLRTNLVVADASRTEKTICLAVSPGLKSFGIPGRPRLFEVVQKVRDLNALRQASAPGREFTGSSWDTQSLQQNPGLSIDYIVAPPRMAHYMECSARIYDIYLKYVAPEDIHVYSIDEVFIDATPYLKLQGLTPHDFAMKMIREVLQTTGITATAGIGPNLYLCKVAMDIVAKHIPPDQDGVRVAQLTELSYRQQLWNHRPLTDFWRLGPGYARKLEQNGIYTMGDVARCSLGKAGEFYNEDLLYKLFGVNAELLIDHAWGWEPCTIHDIKSYHPQSSSLGSGQVLHCPYPFERAKLVVREMTDLLVLDLVDKGLQCDQMVLTVGYDRENLERPSASYHGAVATDAYGRKIPKHAHGSISFPAPTSSSHQITQAVMELFDRITDPSLLVRRVNIVANHITAESDCPPEPDFVQLDLFDASDAQHRREAEAQEMEKEKRRQKAVIGIRKRFGKNAILKGMNLQEGATARDRNSQIGGHKA